MNKLGKVMLEVSEEWFADLPAPEEVPAYTYSKKYLKWEQEVIYGKKHVTLKRVAKVLLVAAILIIMLAVIALSTTKGREFIMQFFKESAVFSLDTKQSEEVNNLTVSYLPKNYQLDDVFESRGMIVYSYSNHNNWIEIRKQYIETTVNFNNERNTYELFEQNGVYYSVLIEKEKICNVVWNYNNFYYQVSGTIDKDEALEIAKGIH